MKFIINYGCGCGENEEIVEAKSLKYAEAYAYEKAIEDYKSFEGLHGIMDIDDVCEEYGIEDRDSEEAWNAYREERESQLNYEAIELDETNEEHRDLLEYATVYEI